jgi:hypothetical protein
MELNFSELDNMTRQNPYEQFNENDYGVDNNSEKYWEQAKSEKEQQTKKKKVSFTDILSNMNLVVSNKGVLQFIKPTNEPQQQDYQYEEQYYQPQQQQQRQNVHQHQQQQQQQQQQRQNVHQHQQHVQSQKPVDPSVKHSYIYNKYFKDYADVTPQAPEKRVPKTIEEYNQMVYEDRIKRIEERKRISEIKSTKLMFTTTPDNHVGQGNPRNIQTSKNSLRKMSFG